MNKYIALAAFLLLTACSSQQAIPTSTAEPSDTPTSTPLPSPSATKTLLIDSVATVNAMLAQVTLNLPTTIPTRTPTPTLSESQTPSPTPMRDTDLDYSTLDRPDDSDLFQIHFIYAIPNDGTDRFRDVSGEIELSANAANYWLSEQTGGSTLRYDTYNGELDITFMKFPYSSADFDALGSRIISGFDQIIRDSGFDTSHKIYIVYYDGLIELPRGQLACGVAIRGPDDWGVTGTLYLRGYSEDLGELTCPNPTRTENLADWLELVMLHEVFHVLGASPGCGPNTVGAHVEDSSYDIMSSTFNPRTSAQLSVLDWNNDDYYNHDIPGCPDLADSVFLDPLPENAQEPPAWRLASARRTYNPFDLLGISPSD
jgi:hypothetical protein